MHRYKNTESDFFKFIYQETGGPSNNPPVESTDTVNEQEIAEILNDVISSTHTELAELAASVNGIAVQDLALVTRRLQSFKQIIKSQDFDSMNDLGAALFNSIQGPKTNDLFQFPSGLGLESQTDFIFAAAVRSEGIMEAKLPIIVAMLKAEVVNSDDDLMAPEVEETLDGSDIKDEALDNQGTEGQEVAPEIVETDDSMVELFIHELLNSDIQAVLNTMLSSFSIPENQINNLVNLVEKMKENAESLQDVENPNIEALFEGVGVNIPDNISDLVENYSPESPMDRFVLVVISELTDFDFDNENHITALNTTLETMDSLFEDLLESSEIGNNLDVSKGINSLTVGKGLSEANDRAGVIKVYEAALFPNMEKDIKRMARKFENAANRGPDDPITGPVLAGIGSDVKNLFQDNGDQTWRMFIDAGTGLQITQLIRSGETQQAIDLAKAEITNQLQAAIPNNEAAKKLRLSNGQLLDYGNLTPEELAEQFPDPEQLNQVIKDIKLIQGLLATVPQERVGGPIEGRYYTFILEGGRMPFEEWETDVHMVEIGGFGRIIYEIMKFVDMFNGVMASIGGGDGKKTSDRVENLQLLLNEFVGPRQEILAYIDENILGEGGEIFDNANIEIQGLWSTANPSEDQHENARTQLMNYAGSDTETLETFKTNVLDSTEPVVTKARSMGLSMDEVLLIANNVKTTENGELSDLDIVLNTDSSGLIINGVEAKNPSEITDALVRAPENTPEAVGEIVQVLNSEINIVGINLEDAENIKENRAFLISLETFLTTEGNQPLTNLLGNNLNQDSWKTLISYGDHPALTVTETGITVLSEDEKPFAEVDDDFVTALGENLESHLKRQQAFEAIESKLDGVGLDDLGDLIDENGTVDETLSVFVNELQTEKLSPNMLGRLKRMELQLAQPPEMVVRFKTANTGFLTADAFVAQANYMDQFNQNFEK